MEEEKSLNSAETPETPAAEEPKGKSKKEKEPKQSKADKKAAKDAKKEKAQIQKDWENSIVTNKRVKREEMRRKLKRAMLFMLVVALIITSVVYIMLLFLDENNVRITASSTKGKAISLSMDNEVWSPYLNGKGPKNMKDLSYNPDYDREHIPTTDEFYEVLMNPDELFKPGSRQTEGYICFAFMLRNDGDGDAIVDYDMTLDYDKERNLQNSVRVMWGTSTRNHPDQANVKVYAALSNNYRLYDTDINKYRTEDGFIEYVAYPSGSDNPAFDLVGWETEMFQGEDYYTYYEKGYFATEPFHSDEFVFKKDGEVLEGNDIMYCYIAIWIEGSDFDCVDSALGGYVKMSINFNAH